MKTPHLFFALLATTFLLHSSLEAADFKSSSSQQVASPSSDSDPYNLHKIVSYYRAARPDPSIIIEGVATPTIICMDILIRKLVFHQIL